MRLSRSTATKRCSTVAGPRLARGVLVAPRVVGVPRREPPGLAVEGRGEEQRLAVARAGGDDPVDGRAEAHVEHAVGLVEDEDLDVRRA